MPAVITAKNLTVRFGDFTAVDNVSFDIEKGEVFGFLGPNGSGKTTIIKALCGLVPVTSGTGSILGMDIRKNSAEIKHHVGYMSQRFGLYEDLTTMENLNFYGSVYGLGGATLKQRKQDVIELTGLAPYLDRRAARLSGGWETAARAGLRHHSFSRSGISRRTDSGHRSGCATGVMGSAVQAFRRGRDVFCDHSLYGRG